jgi:hypothetical protein
MDMKLKQLIAYENSPTLEATWTDTVTTQELVPVYSEDDPEVIDHWEMGPKEEEVVAKCRAYSADQMDELREDLGPEDALLYKDLIDECASKYVPPTPLPLEERQNAVWMKIKAERDRRKTLGIQVGDYWFHSDADSRIQWLGLKDTARDMLMDGAEKTDSIFVDGGPVIWKTLSGDFTPVNIQLALDVNDATKVLDAKLFKNAEFHRINMLILNDPEEYDYSTGWPASFEDE